MLRSALQPTQGIGDTQKHLGWVDGQLGRKSGEDVFACLQGVRRDGRGFCREQGKLSLEVFLREAKLRARDHVVECVERV